MALFSKNKPTKRIEFEGGWVELQYLSKGAKDEIANRLSSMFAGMDNEVLKKMDNFDKDDVPAAMIGVVGKVQEVEYYKLSNAIKSWSETDIPVTVESVKDLDDEVFDKISKAIDEMNKLKEEEIKN
ncbi:hypothetical protein [Mesobacillus stamsii]|uniref:Tail assembly chaperone n=1 Tax=Mesobacillus stamsii TaxID=225347 RepID=A0ABU0FXF9_9BACI|nr:hypothetical protein [Mesobacillus stamsii]MDQ0414236.1 hypothetical protein [Mesobacillus stamsii]